MENERESEDEGEGEDDVQDEETMEMDETNNDEAKPEVSEKQNIAALDGAA